MTGEVRYWYGGKGGYRPGDVVTEEIAVEISTNKDLAKMRAAGIPNRGGALYRVDPIPAALVELGADGQVAYAPKAKILSVIDAVVVAKRTDLRRWARWEQAQMKPKHKAEDE